MAVAVSSPRSAPAAPHHPARLKRLRALLGGVGAETLLVTNPLDVGYLTGFLGGDSYLLVTSAGRPVLISDFRYQEELEEVRPLADVQIRTKGLAESAADCLRERSIARCAVQGEHISLSEFNLLQTFPGAPDFVPTANLVGQLRRTKDEAEIGLIRRAIRIQQQALEAVLPALKPGISEREVAGRLESEMKSRGSSEPGFKTIVAARANGSLPHYRPGRDKLAANRAVLIDWGAVCQGYHGDMTRVFALGKWPPKLREIYRVVLDAQQAAAAALAPGQSTHAIDAIARVHITTHGYGEYFGHGLGHGLGLNGHEEPRLNPLTPNDTLRSGDVVTVEPGIYIPGLGGVRIEDDYLITDKGAVNLCGLPKDLEWATL